MTILFQQLQQGNYIVLLMMTVASTVGMFILLPLCYFGKLATESFEEMSDCVYHDINWSGASFEIQKIIAMMIANLQRPLYYHGFHIVHLNLNTFLSVSLKDSKFIA